MNKIIVDGLDRLGKSSLISEIQNHLGYYQVLHFSKPKELPCYDSLFKYQRASFINLFRLLRNDDAKIICDRSHIGEYVYAKYRNYSGDYIFDLEKKFMINSCYIKFILLTQDFGIEKTEIKDDGLSLASWENRKSEQDHFIEAFSKSIIYDKRMINVLNKDGSYRPIRDIFNEAFE